MAESLVALSSPLCDLPDELLLEIYGHLDDESLLWLGSTCKILHFTALHFLVERHDIKDPTDGWIFLYDSPTVVLKALRIALFLTKLESLSCYPNGNLRRLLGEISEISLLMERLSSLKSFSVMLSIVDRWIRYDAKDSKVLDETVWYNTFTSLLELAIQKSCTHLCITGGHSIHTLYCSPRAVSGVFFLLLCLHSILMQ